jgi:hypothetical protein
MQICKKRYELRMPWQQLYSWQRTITVLWIWKETRASHYWKSDCNCLVFSRAVFSFQRKKKIIYMKQIMDIF